MKKIVNGICILLGFVFLAVGIVGTVLPVLPTKIGRARVGKECGS